MCVAALIDKTPPIPYKFVHYYRRVSGRNSAVECQLPKLDVAGSTPVARSKIFNGLHVLCVGHFYFSGKFWNCYGVFCVSFRPISGLSY